MKTKGRHPQAWERRPFHCPARSLGDHKYVDSVEANLARGDNPDPRSSGPRR